MVEFVKRKKAKKLLKIFEDAVTDNGQIKEKNPLYKRAMGDRGFFFEIEKPYFKLLELLNKHNGYGDPQLFSGFKDRKEREEFDGEFRKMLTKPEGIEKLDTKMLSQLIFMFNRSIDRQNRVIAEKISDGTLAKILKRAIELGPHTKDDSKSDLAVSVPTP